MESLNLYPHDDSYDFQPKNLLSYKSVYQILKQIAMGQRVFASGRNNLFLFVLTHT